MFSSSIVTFALLSTSALAIQQEKRQATDDGQFTSAASNLISQYIPSTVLPGLESAIASAASAASVSGDAKELLYSALLAENAPAWFKSAIPDVYSTQIAALEGNVDALRPTGATPGGVLVPVVIAITTTDSAGSTFTTSVTSTAPSATGTTIGAGAGSTFSSLTTQVIDGVTSVFSTAVAGASSVASEISSGGSSVASEIASGGSSVASVISSGGSSVASHISTGVTGVAGDASSVASHISTGVTSVAGEASSVVSEISSGVSSVASHASTGITSVIGGASSIASEASTALVGTSTSTAGGSMPTGLSGAAAGVIGMIGMMVAL